MIIFHTADWHLGQKFGEYDRKYEHTRFLEWLEEQLTANAADALLIAGDVFDSANPSADSQRMFYTFLRNINSKLPMLQVVIVAGNHDSAGRLEAPQVLLESLNITIRGTIPRTSVGEINYNHLIVPLKKNGVTQALCLAVPYLRQGDYPTAKTYEDGVSNMYLELHRATQQSGLPIVSMGHLHTSGAVLSDADKSERIMIGGLDAVSAAAFPPDIAYTALGHLHRPQKVFGRENVRYSGSPIHMSFAEKNYRHGVVKVVLKQRENPTITTLPFEPPVAFVSLETDDKSTLFEQLAALPNGEITETSPFIEVKFHQKEPEPTLNYQIDRALEGKSVRLVWKKAIMPTRTHKEQNRSYNEFRQITPLQIAEDVYHSHFQNDMPAPMVELLTQVINEIIENQ